MPRLPYSHILILILVFLPVLGWNVVSTPLHNITITAPLGTTQHGDDHLFCVPTRPWDIIIFFLVNYATHAFTVRSYPGESLLDFTWGTLAALFLPTSGMIRGFTAIMRSGFAVKRAFFGEPLEIAARSGALCMVVGMKGWKPLRNTKLFQVALTSTDPARSVDLQCSSTHFMIMFQVRVHPPGPESQSLTFADPFGVDRLTVDDRLTFGDFLTGLMLAFNYLISNLCCIDYGTMGTSSLRATSQTYIPRWIKDVSYGIFFPDTLTITTGTRKIHGNQCLPVGYALAFVPRVAKVLPLDDVNSHTVPPPRFGLLKGLVSLGQAIYAFATFSAALQTQVRVYGYAAFGLTVLPYAVMSALNLFGAILTPEFDELYLIQSDILLEARALPGAKFEGVVGRLLPVDADPPDVPRLFENTFSATVEGQANNTNTGLRMNVEDYHFDLLPANPDHDGLTIEIPACSKFQERVQRHNQLGDYPSWFIISMLVMLTFVSPGGPLISVYMGWQWFRYEATRQGTFVVLMMLVLYSNAGIYAAIFFVPAGGGTETFPSQTLWIILWLVTGTVYGALATLGQFIFPSHRVGTTAKIIALCIGAIPAIGGLRVVAQMLLDYGTCIQYD
ncbi:hypothetical protein DFH09DRAFT_1413242 [Mycena vulgaris]|nr:hypothetical protein DFH09DRAFT_1413242 [Mycena vulgaris]